MAGPTPAFWQQRFETDSTPWDRGEAGPHLQRWLASGAIAPGERVVVPGCGSGWEVAALAAAGVAPYHCDIHAMRALFPSTDWAWPKPPYAHVAHPSGAYELAVELMRQV